MALGKQAAFKRDGISYLRQLHFLKYRDADTESVQTVGLHCG